MKCPRCGRQNNLGNPNCYNCGTPLLQPAMPPKMPLPQVPPPMPPQMPPQAPMPMPFVPPPQAQMPIILPPLPMPMPMPMPIPLPQSGPLPMVPQQRLIKPTSGVCSVCERESLVFHDNGMGECTYCGRTFNWLNPQQAPALIEQDLALGEDNPFMVSEDEVLTASERKAEVESEDIVYHSPLDSKKRSGKDDKKSGKKDEASDEDDLSDIQRLEMLEDRLLIGEISEEIYLRLREKFTASILESLEDRLVSGKISENKYNELKRELE